MGRKHCEKSRKWSLPALYPLSTVFSKDFFLRNSKSWYGPVAGQPFTTQQNFGPVQIQRIFRRQYKREWKN